MLWTAFLFFFGSGWFDQTSIKIDVAHDTERERQTRSLLEQVLVSYDLSGTPSPVTSSSRNARSTTRFPS